MRRTLPYVGAWPRLRGPASRQPSPIPRAPSRWWSRSPRARRSIPSAASSPSACACRSGSPSSLRMSAALAGSLGVGSRRARGSRRLYYQSWQHQFACSQRRHLPASVRCAEGFRAGRAARQQPATDHLKKCSAGERPEGAHRVAEGESRQGVSRNWWHGRRGACRRRVLPEGDGHALPVRALSRHQPGAARFDRRADRPAV